MVAGLITSGEIPHQTLRPDDYGCDSSVFDKPLSHVRLQYCIFYRTSLSIGRATSDVADLITKM
jgi:hypothetical protein